MVPRAEKTVVFGWSLPRKILFVVCMLLFLSGAAQTAIGTTLYLILSYKSLERTSVHVYWAGCASLLCGFAGVIVLLKGKKQEKLIWGFATGTCMAVQQIVLALMMAFSPSSYGTRVDLIESCRQVKLSARDGVCMCSPFSGKDVDRSSYEPGELIGKYYTIKSVYNSCEDMNAVLKMYLVFMSLNGLYIVLVLVSLVLLYRVLKHPVKRRIRIPAGYFQTAIESSSVKQSLKASRSTEARSPPRDDEAGMSTDEDETDDVTVIKQQLRQTDGRLVNLEHTLPLLSPDAVQNLSTSSDMPCSSRNYPTVESGDNVVNERQEHGSTVLIKPRYGGKITVYSKLTIPKMKRGYRPDSIGHSRSLGSLNSKSSSSLQSSGSARDRRSRAASRKRSREPGEGLPMPRRLSENSEKDEEPPPLPPRITPANSPVKSKSSHHLSALTSRPARPTKTNLEQSVSNNVPGAALKDIGNLDESLTKQVPDARKVIPGGSTSQASKDTLLKGHVETHAVNKVCTDSSCASVMASTSNQADSQVISTLSTKHKLTKETEPVALVHTGMEVTLISTAPPSANGGNGCYGGARPKTKSYARPHIPQTLLLDPEDEAPPPYSEMDIMVRQPPSGASRSESPVRKMPVHSSDRSNVKLIHPKNPTEPATKSVNRTEPASSNIACLHHVDVGQATQLVVSTSAETTSVVAQCRPHIQHNSEPLTVSQATSSNKPRIRMQDIL